MARNFRITLQQLILIAFITITETKPPQDEIVCINDGFVPHPINCQLFYWCSLRRNGRAIELACNPEEIFDTETHSCMYPWLSTRKECGGLVTKKQNNESNRKQIIRQNEIKNRECIESGFLADEENCKKFYRCVDNGNGKFITYEYTCGVGTVWDSEINGCNYPWAVRNDKCRFVTNEPEEQAENEEQSQTYEEMNEIQHENNCREGEFSANPNDCTKFHMCINDGTGGYVKHEFTCGSGTFWDSNSNNCTRKSDTCRNQNPTETEAGAFAICTEEGFMSDPNECNKFYRCVSTDSGGFIAYQFTCGQGTVWDEELSACNYPNSVTNRKCNNNNTGSVSNSSEGSTNENSVTTVNQQSTNLISNGAEGNSSFKCIKEGFFGDSFYCKKFHRCVDNEKGGFIKYEFTCGQETVWDPALQTCNYPSSATGCVHLGNLNRNETEGNGASVTETENEKHTTTTERNIVSVTQTETEQHITGSTEQSTTSVTQTETEQHITESTEQNTASVTQTETEQHITESTEQNTASVIHNETEKPSITTDQNTVSVTQTETENLSTTTEQNTASITQTETEQHITGSTEQNSASVTQTETEEISTTEQSTVSVTQTETEEHITEQNTVSVTQAEKHTTAQNTAQTETEQYTTTTDQNTPSITQTASNNQTETTTSSSSQEVNTTKQPDVTTSTTKKPNSTTKCTSEGFYPDLNDCKKFIRCVSNGRGSYTKFNFQCPTGTIWDSDLDTCNYPHVVQNKKCEQNNSIHEEPKNSCGEEGFFPNGDDCKKFYRCVGNGKGNFLKYDFTCGEGTVWDQQLQTCNYPSKDNSCRENQTEQNTTEKATTTSVQPTKIPETTQNIETTTQEELTTGTQTTEMQTKPSITEATETSQILTTELQTSSILTTTQSEETHTTAKTEEATNPTTQSTETTTENSQTTIQTTNPIGSTIFTTQTEETQTTAKTEETTNPTTQSAETTKNSQTTTIPISSTIFTTTQTEEVTTIQIEETTSSVISSTHSEEISTNSASTSTVEETTTQSSNSIDSTTQTEETIATDEQTTALTEFPHTRPTESTTEPGTTILSNTTTSCPLGQLEGDQISLVCPTGFKRHPKYCNLFYQCTSNPMTYEIKILVMSCPNKTIYDDTKIQCLPPEETQQRCSGQIANENVFRTAQTYSLPPVELPSNESLCSHKGSYAINPLECDNKFIKCRESNETKHSLQGFVYQCPDNYIFWNVSKKCERISKALNCNEKEFIRMNRWNIPRETENF